MLERFDFEELTKERRKAIKESIRTINFDEVKKLGDELFPYVDDSWREAFFQFINEHRNATFHHAVTNDGVHLLYCRAEDRGIWFLPGSGKGLLQERGRQAMKSAIEGGK